ncbi:hypothetical protein [Streptomyces fulvoviolaceus]|uniref:hypothetical protein n=1 Tax=Streptomyces fulvoviolaceus TaxID=285535 RepID=UPI0004C96F56|nr:hypothetical protein [Streptomyces fulvoviolaceus]MCT9079000.1 hypothetical protein [Streptomyces fulvoviolaceus]
MTGMHKELVIAGVLVVTTGVVFSALAIITGWILPGPGRAKILRPRVWGYGTLVSTAGTGVFMFLGPFGAPDGHYASFAVAGLAVTFAGLYVQYLAQRPGRDAPTA